VSDCRQLPVEHRDDPVFGRRKHQVMVMPIPVEN
jgi:hypothetical protein